MVLGIAPMPPGLRPRPRHVSDELAQAPPRSIKPCFAAGLPQLMRPLRGDVRLSCGSRRGLKQ
eukprot:4772823-Prorocentrum_lima.AAC.1